MNLRERIQALRSRRASDKLDKPLVRPKANLKSTSPAGTPSKQSRTHSVAARQQWHRQQLQNAAKKARQNIIDTGVYDVITRAPPPEKKEEPLVKAEPPDHSENEDTRDGNESDGPELEEEQMERDEEERALEHANQRLLLDGNSKQSADQPQEQLTTADEEHEPHRSSQHHLVKTHEQTELTEAQIKDKPSSGANPSQAPDESGTTRPTGENDLQPDQHPSDALEENQDAPTTEKQRCDDEEQNPKPQTRPAPVQDTSPQTPDQPARKATAKKNNFRWFDKAPPLNPLGMVDDEAHEDNADEAANLVNERDDLFDAHANESDGDDDGIDHDEVSPSATDKNKLAQFHRRWQLDKEKNDLAVAAAGGVVDDIDEAVDLTDLLQKDGQHVKDNESDHDASLSGADNTVNEADETKRQSENYMEQMYVCPCYSLNNHRKIFA
ncbi:hypothetical protein FGB62_25g65 [Gracilaria domingensis]|nr:hypothetical protein FGB62_25g65 [Gracilaria domingensis]